jgi:hypothetical protein
MSIIFLKFNNKIQFNLPKYYALSASHACLKDTKSSVTIPIFDCKQKLLF